ncbi:radical SAM family heme chaperone HemW [Tepidiforma sp.]|uniref:radical SAM family heme chaperone HemW n=1 Tax=Tepidiforma sp. TaxID=2682230 RepID=UPI002ADDD87A|nr:radical SAM family heme chaperone HemW [Tepidiforma sp.]
MTAPIAVYVHIPFCTIKCGYCDFNAYAGMDALKDAYAAALLAEARASAPLLAGRTIASVGFGGGTPGEVPPAHIAGVISALRELAPFAPGAEITLEVNPGTTSPARLARLRQAGVTRLSIGAQSFHPEELASLDRIHSPQATIATFRAARRLGFPSLNLDLIYGLPGQPLDRWLESLRCALELEPDHLSLYALTIEEGTLLARRIRDGDVPPPDPDLAADMYEAAADVLEEAGFEQYELSNWARPGHQSRHNRTYWTDGDYLALGAGAHGYLSGERYENLAHPRAYIEAVRAAPPAQPRPALARVTTPAPPAQVADWLALRLRLLEGFDPAEFEERWGFPLERAVGPVLEDCAAAGLLERAPRVRLTRRGTLLHGEVAARFLSHLQRHWTERLTA